MEPVSALPRGSVGEDHALSTSPKKLHPELQVLQLPSGLHYRLMHWHTPEHQLHSVTRCRGCVSPLLGQPATKAQDVPTTRPRSGRRIDKLTYASSKLIHPQALTGCNSKDPREEWKDARNAPEHVLLDKQEVGSDSLDACLSLSCLVVWSTDLISRCGGKSYLDCPVHLA